MGVCVCAYGNSNSSDPCDPLPLFLSWPEALKRADEGRFGCRRGAQWGRRAQQLPRPIGEEIEAAESKSDH